MFITMNKKNLYIPALIGVVALLWLKAFLSVKTPAIKQNVAVSDEQVLSTSSQKGISYHKDALLDPIVYENKIIQDILNKAQEVFKQQKLADGGIYHDIGYLEWQNSDGWYITDMHSSSVSSVYLCQNNYQTPFEKVAPTIYGALDKMFVENNFTINDMNTMSGYDRSEFVDMGYSYNKAYEKDNVQCLIRGVPECAGLPGGFGEKYGSPIDVVCTDNLSEDAKTQLPILKALNLKNDAIKEVKYFGDFVFISARFDEIVAKKSKDGAYKIVYRGQDTYSCDIAEKYDFPGELRDFLKVNCANN